jgi:FkbM family methyltransferase
MSDGSPVFISYSANCEDVILNRVFGSRNSGFYVDVGAAHPLYENDTNALYNRGWHGINIEPDEGFFQELNAQRPRDRNINAAVSDTPGRLLYHEVVGTGLSTCDPEEAERAATKGFKVVPHTIKAMSLRQILEEEVPPEIDLLKVDVEGFELKVLSSNDWRRFRPKVILSEATFPESPCRRPDVVSPYLAEQGYRRVYFDGLNDYYVERDFEPPSGVFDRPPNVFDHFQSYALHRLTLEHDNAKVYISSLEKALRRITHTAQAAEVDVDNARIELRAMHERGRALAAQLDAITAQQTAAADELQLVYRSTSWRITRPMRALARPRRTLRMILGRVLK